jgi:hypothetical protein
MAASVTYTVVDGEIIHETRGGVDRFYVPDILGSTAMLVDASGAVTDTWIYWPYGEVQSHSGSSETSFTSFGTKGCYTDLPGMLYARSRELMTDIARWASPDEYWPTQEAYTYANSMPTLAMDQSGKAQSAERPKNNFKGVIDTCLDSGTLSLLRKKATSKSCAEALKSITGSTDVVGILGSSTGAIVGYFAVKACAAPPDAPPNTKIICSTYPYPQKSPSNPNPKCQGGLICIDEKAFCNDSADGQACGLLAELGNSYQCKKNGNFGHEESAKKLLAACGCSDIGTGGGVKKGG